MTVMHAFSLSLAPSASAWIRDPNLNPCRSLRSCRSSLVCPPWRRSSFFHFSSPTARVSFSLHHFVTPPKHSFLLGLSSCSPYSITTCFCCYYPFRFQQFSRQQNKKRKRHIRVWGKETVESTGYAEVDAYDDDGDDGGDEEQSSSSSSYFADLEDQLYDFMINSANPNSFPAKKDLVAAGRMDLVQAVSKCGGWFALGWDVHDSYCGTNAQQLGGSGGQGGGNSSTSSFLEQRQLQEIGDGRASSSLDASSSGRETDNREMDAGIDGILFRLEKERRFSYGFTSIEKKANGRHSKGNSHQGSTTRHLATENISGGSLKWIDQNLSNRVFFEI